MYRFRISLTLLLLTCCLSQAQSQQQDKSPLPFIPSDFNLVFKFRSPEPTMNSIREVFSESASELSDFVELMPVMLESTLGNLGMAGVDQGSDVWMAIRYRAGEDPEKVFLVVSKKPDELKEALGDLYHYFSTGKWTVYSESAEAVELFQKLQDGTGKGLNKFIDPNCVEILARGDLAVWADLQSIRRAYEDQIELMKSQTSDAIQNLPGAIPNQDSVDSAQIVQNFELTFENAMTLLKDSRAFCGNVTVNKGGVLFDSYVSFSFSSETAKFVKALPTSDFKSLDKLPQSHLVYLGVSGLTQSFMNWGLNFSTAAVTDEDQRKKFTEAFAELAELGYGSMTLSADIGAPGEAASQTVTQLELDDPARYREITPRLLEALGGIETNGIKLKHEFQTEAEEYGDYKADVFSMSYESTEPANPQSLMQLQAFNSIYGPDGMKTRTFYFEDRILQVVGSDDLVGLALDSYLGRPISRKPSANDKRQSNKPRDNAESSVGPLFSELLSSLSRRRDSHAMFMIEDEPQGLLIAQSGRRKGREGGLKLNIPLENQKSPPAQTPDKPASNPPDPAEGAPTEGTPAKGTPPDPGSPANSTPATFGSAPPVDNGPQELPPRDVANALKIARGRLSPKSNLLLLIDLPALIAKNLRRFPIVAAMGIPVSKFVKAAQEPSFTGISLAADGNAFRFRVSVPTAQLNGINNVVAVVRPMLENLQSGKPPVDLPPPTLTPAAETPANQPGTPDPAETTTKTPPPPAIPSTPPPSKKPDEETKQRRLKEKGKER